jgi:hypothetical protein
MTDLEPKSSRFRWGKGSQLRPTFCDPAPQKRTDGVIAALDGCYPKNMMVFSTLVAHDL